MWTIISPVLLGVLAYVLVMQIVENIRTGFTGSEESEDEPRK